MRKPPTRRQLIAKVDKAFSLMVRKNAADHRGLVECSTCAKVMPWQESQAGHWIKRGHHATRWDPRNVHPQCRACNLYLGGAMDQMAYHIIRTHGDYTIGELLHLKHTEKRWTMPELRELLAQFTSAVK